MERFGTCIYEQNYFQNHELCNTDILFFPHFLYVPKEKTIDFV